MKQSFFRRIRAALLIFIWFGLLFIPFRTFWDDTHWVTNFAQTILFMAIVMQSFRLVEAGLARKVRCNVVRVIRRKTVVNRTFWGRHWRLDRQYMVVTDGNKEIVASRLILSNAIGTGDQLVMYRSLLDFRKRTVDRYTVFGRIAMIAIALGVLMGVTQLPHV